MNINEAERVYKALGNRRRIAILKLIHRADRLPVKDIADEIRLSFKATSKHLQLMESANLVESEQVSIEQWYQLKKPLHPFLEQMIMKVSEIGFSTFSNSREWWNAFYVLINQFRTYAVPQYMGFTSIKFCQTLG